MRRLAVVILVVSCALLLVVLANAYVHRNADYSCHLAPRPFNAEALGIDQSVEQAYGFWSWWPTGLTCAYPRVGGGFVTAMPEPYIPIVFVAGLSGVAVGTVLALRSRVP